MPDREELIAVLRSGASYQEVGHRYGLPPGQVYMIVTGRPADGSDAPAPEWLERHAEFLLAGSTQHLANPPTEVPTTDDRVLAWIKQRAAADGPLQAAAAARTADPPPLDERSEDVVEVIGHQHNQLKYLAEQLQALPSARTGGAARYQQRRVSVVDMIRVRDSAHVAAEEGYLWPLVRERVDGGAELADHALTADQHGKDVLQELDGLAGDDPRFDDLVEELSAVMRKHDAFVDMVLLKVRGAVREDERADVGRKLRRAAEHGPTRPHPHAPSGNKLATAAAVPIDRLRDAIGDRPAQRQGRAEAGDEDGGQA